MSVKRGKIPGAPHTEHKAAHTWPKAVQTWPKAVHIWPKAVQTWPKPVHICAKVIHLWMRSPAVLGRFTGVSVEGVEALALFPPTSRGSAAGFCGVSAGVFCDEPAASAPT